METPAKFKIIFMGSSSFAEIIFKDLVKNNYNIISVYTQEGEKENESQIETLAKENNIAIERPNKLDEKAINKIREQKPDLIIVASYGKILPEELLKIPEFGALNAHPSLLPKFRGPSPIQNTLLEGVSETGTTIMLMDKGVDTGDILSQKKISLDRDETYPGALQKMAELSANLLAETIPLWAEKKITLQKQNDSEATYCQMIERSDGKIIWSDDAISIYNKFRAFYPWPGIFTFWKKDGQNLRLKMHKISLKKSGFDPNYKISEVIKAGEKILVKAGDGSIVLEEIQLEGKAKTTAADFINGYPEFIGSRLE